MSAAARLKSTRTVAAAWMAAIMIAGCGGGTPAPAANSTGTATGSPIQIASVGALSGAASSSLKSIATGLQAWVQYVNSHGGIQGHPVVLDMRDSHSVPADEAAAIQQVVQEKSPVALVGVGPLSLKTSVPFLTQRHIPVIGGTNDDVVWTTTPGFFTQKSSFPTAMFALTTHRTGEEKFGMAYCKEAPTCTAADQLIIDKGLAKANGANPVFNQQIALGQPDYTALCLAAKGAGVQTLALSADSNSIITIASSCNRQGYHPTFTFSESGVHPTLAGQPGLEGTISPLKDAPWFIQSTGGDTLRSAMNAYYPSEEVNPNTVTGWVAGLTFKRAAEIALKANPSKPLTNNSILQALGTFRGEVIDGMTPPLTYSADQANAQIFCYFPITVKGGQWVVLDGKTSATCAPDAVHQLLASVQ